jgi:hypothetical protein
MLSYDRFKHSEQLARTHIPFQISHVIVCCFVRVIRATPDARLVNPDDVLVERPEAVLVHANIERTASPSATHV